MDIAIQQKLLTLNRSFYNQFAGSFAKSRRNPQPGFYKLLEHMPDPCEEALDIGCGNGRFGRFLSVHNPDIFYNGVDFSEELLSIAREEINGFFYKSDISQPDFLNGLGKFDLIICLAVMQHLPSFETRSAFLEELASHLSSTGRIFLANWQFLESDRQRKKIINWQVAGIDENELEHNDYLLSWNRDGYGFRYVCMIDKSETDRLAKKSKLRILAQFRDDGREGNLNLYSVLANI